MISTFAEMTTKEALCVFKVLSEKLGNIDRRLNGSMGLPGEG